MANSKKGTNKSKKARSKTIFDIKLPKDKKDQPDKKADV